MLSSEEKALLVKAQQGWIQLRDNSCQFEVYGSGSLGKALVLIR